jgi:hypothetical protein
MTAPTTNYTFSYIVVDERLMDKQWKPILGIYSFATSDEHETPVQVLQSLAPAITVNVYAGNPYPSFDITEVIERRVKLDIHAKSNFSSLENTQINDSKWHLTVRDTASEVEVY